MATADELLSTLDTDKTLIIDKDLRIITIPSSVKNLGVESDDDVLRLKFSMPRMYGDVDLSDFSIYINYMNAKNTGDVYVVDDKTIADDTITFSWLVGRVALAYKGSVRFIVCMKLYDSAMAEVIKEYNTTIASLPVLEGLETSEAAIEQNPDILTYINELINMKVDIITPTIGDNGNWYLGDTDTNKPSRGEKGADGATGATGADGKSAYSYAQDGGYSGTETEFAAKLAAESIDKALFVVNITRSSGGTYSADKTFDEIVQVYNEGKYNIVAKVMGVYIMPTLSIKSNRAVIFGSVFNQGSNIVDSLIVGIAPDNSIQTIQTPLATLNDALPNPYALTFTGAVSGSYDGSSAKTIEIPSGGSGEKEWTVLVDQELSAETPGSFSITGLNNFTEFYAEWDALQHGTNNTTDSGMYFWINDIQVSSNPSFCPVYAPSKTPKYGWTMAKYNGLRWLLAKSEGATSKENTLIASHTITQYYPSNISAPATKVYVGNSGNYAAVSGHFRLWGR